MRHCPCCQVDSPPYPPLPPRCSSAGARVPFPSPSPSAVTSVKSYARFHQCCLLSKQQAFLGPTKQPLKATIVSRRGGIFMLTRAHTHIFAYILHLFPARFPAKTPRRRCESRVQLWSGFAYSFKILGAFRHDAEGPETDGMPHKLLRRVFLQIHFRSLARVVVGVGVLWVPKWRQNWRLLGFYGGGSLHRCCRLTAKADLTDHSRSAGAHTTRQQQLDIAIILAKWSKRLCCLV